MANRIPHILPETSKDWDNKHMPPAEVINRNEHHKAHRAGWLRAAVLGANDGLVSTSALMVGVAATQASFGNIMAAGVAGLAAGAMSMAAGEYVSVKSQSDIEDADRLMEIEHLAADPEGELEELAEIYEQRGLKPELAREVAVALTEFDAVGAHLREELGHHETSRARPTQAAIASAVSFVIGGAIPFIGMMAADEIRVQAVVIVSVLGLVVAGVAAAIAAGCGLLRPTIRVVVGGSLAMAVTYAVGSFFDLGAL
jgi:VIT1/CCC1 family predicted Fe2+/Mn2+ transporter